MAISPLSDRQIDDDIIRSSMYRYILSTLQSRSVTYTEHEIKEDEMYRADLISYRVYRTGELRWLVSLLGDEEDETEALPVGLVIRMPSKAWLFETIRMFKEGRDITAVTNEVQ